MTDEDRTWFACELKKNNAAKNGWRAWIPVALPALVIVAGFMLFVFKTKLAAEEEHNDIVAVHNADVMKMAGNVSDNASNAKLLLQRLEFAEEKSQELVEAIRRRHGRGAVDD